MRPNRTTVPTIAVTASVAALISGLAVSAVTARQHHHKAPPPPATIGLAQQENIAHQLAAMTLPRGITHTTICPRNATSTDACFASAESTLPTNPLAAGGEMVKMLTTIDGLVLGLHQGCLTVTGGPQGSGFNCTADGHWRGHAVEALVFVSSSKQRPAGAPALDAVVSVLATMG